MSTVSSNPTLQATADRNIRGCELFSIRVRGLQNDRYIPVPGLVQSNKDVCCLPTTYDDDAPLGRAPVPAAGGAAKNPLSRSLASLRSRRMWSNAGLITKAQERELDALAR